MLYHQDHIDTTILLMSPNKKRFTLTLKLPFHIGLTISNILKTFYVHKSVQIQLFCCAIATCLVAYLRHAKPCGGRAPVLFNSFLPSIGRSPKYTEVLWARGPSLGAITEAPTGGLQSGLTNTTSSPLYMIGSTYSNAPYSNIAQNPFLFQKTFSS